MFNTGRGLRRIRTGATMHNNISKSRRYAKACLRCLALILFIAGLDSPALAAVWQASGSMSAGRSNHTAILLHNGKVLVTGGYNNSGALSLSELYDPSVGTFATTGSMNAARDSHTATLLPNSKVLVAGGAVGSAVLSSAELYDPAAGTFSATGSMSVVRSSYTATLLPNGKVLVSGGWNGSTAHSSAELYDPVAGTFSTTGTMSTARYSHTATLLPNGKVLITGGVNGSYEFLSSAELYDPTTGTFSATGSMSVARKYHAAILLPNGKVLVSGGIGLSSAELYDPADGTFSTTGSMNATMMYNHTATLLPNGKVLLIGGNDGASSYLSSAESYDPDSGAFSAAGSMSAARDNHTATLLSNGKVLVTGGHSNSGYLSSAELYVFSGGSGTFFATGSMGAAKYSHVSVVLPDGRVLIAGGYNGAAVATAEIYDPAAGTFTGIVSMSAARCLYAATLLPNGKVLLVGGNNSGGFLSSAELYDPTAGTFSATGSMSAARAYHTVTLLSNGKVLVTGGTVDFTGDALSSAELYDPDAGTFSVTGALVAARGLHTATLLPTGKVLLVGGSNATAVVKVASAELYDPDAGTFTGTGPMSAARNWHTATLLPNSKVLVAGGEANGGASLASAELYDPAAGTFSATGAMNVARGLHTAALLPNGKVLVTGGRNGGAYLSSADLYDPSAGTFASVGPMTTARREHIETLLPNGKVLLAGGTDGSALASAELYDTVFGDSITGLDPSFSSVFASSITASWMSISGANYVAVLASDSGYSSIVSSTTIGTNSKVFEGLSPNTSYYFEVKLSTETDAAFTANRISTITLPNAAITTPTGIYFDEVSSTSITASGYAAAGFTGLETGLSGVNVAKDGTYSSWRNGNTWTTKAPMPTARYHLSVGVIGGKLYAVGGNNGGLLNTNEEYDPASNTWTTKAVMPTARDGLSAGVIGGRLYAVGGDNGGLLNANEEYDPASNTWATKAAMPTARQCSSAGVTGGKLYVVGGGNGSLSYVNTNEEYDPAANTWNTKTAMPSARTYLSVSVIGDKLYAVGGNGDSSFLNTNEEYNPATNTWSTKTAMPTARTILSAGVIGGKLYAVGGNSSGNLATNEEYDPASNTWTTKTVMPTARHGLSVGVIGGKLYALGGHNGIFLNTNEEYDPGVASSFTALTPNTQYNFKAKARDASGLETPESPVVSTYTLAAVAIPGSWQPFTAVYTSSVTVTWSSGTASGGYNGSGASYLVQASTSSNFLPVLASSSTRNTSATLAEFNPNATHYFRAQAYNTLGVTDYSWLVLGSTVTSPTQSPTLAWTGETNYAADGVDPETGDTVTPFVYHVKYTDADNDAPANGYPKLYVLKSGTTVQTLTMNFVSGSNSTGAIYSTSTMLSALGADYSYHFEAYDVWNATATGAPAALVDAPNVISIPATALAPDFIVRTTTTLTASWTAVTGANYVAVLASDSGYASAVSSVTQSETTKAYSGLSAGTSYYFEVKLATETDTAFASNRISTITTSAPALAWTGEANYTADGLDPETGNIGTSFIYRVKYTDADNEAPGSGYPKVHILKAGSEISGSPFTMVYVSGSNTTGAIYTYSKTLAAVGTDYTYYFEAQDSSGTAASGMPTYSVDAPDVAGVARQADYKTTVCDNLFNPRTGGTSKVKFNVPASGKVSLKIYDLSGKLIRTLYEGDYGPGDFQRDWDGKDDSGRYVFPSVYLLHYVYPGGKEVRKIGVRR